MTCLPSRHPLRRREGGAALVIAMLVFALCTVLIVSMKSEFTLFYQRGSNYFVSEQAYAYLRGAEDLATMALQLDYDQDGSRERPRDDLQELWAQPSTPYTLDEGGWLVGNLEDLQGRFNLNTLLPGERSDGTEPPLTASQKQFVRLLQTLPELELGVREATVITRAVGDWLDGNAEVSPDGAEDDYYFGQTPAYRAANRPMADVSELRAVANVTQEIYTALLPWVVALPESVVTLNIHTAAPLMLRTINGDDDLQPLAVQDAETLIQHRCDTTFTDVADFLEHPVFADKKLEGIKPLLGSISSYFLLSAETEVADRRVRLYSVLERQGRQINTLSRTSGSLIGAGTKERVDFCAIAP